MGASHVRVLAITSGKGGVGKSCISLNLAIALARRGRRVLLVDADMGLGNLGILLGAGVEHTLEDALRGSCPVSAAVLEGPEGVCVLPAASDTDVEFWERAQVDGEAVKGLDEMVAGFDFALVDTGAGIAARSIDFAAAADETLLVVTPEPTAIADAYATLKALLARRPEMRVGLLVNMADSREEAEDLHAKFREIAARFLGAEIDNRAYIPLDRYVRESVKRQVPFALASPPPPAAEALAHLAEALCREEAMERQRGLFEAALWQRGLATGPERA